MHLGSRREHLSMLGFSMCGQVCMQTAPPPFFRSSFFRPFKWRTPMHWLK